MVVANVSDLKCTACGNDIARDENPFCTTAEEQVGTPGQRGAKTEMHYLVLCPQCAERRRGNESFLVWMFIAIVVGLVLVGMFP